MARLSGCGHPSKFKSAAGCSLCAAKPDPAAPLPQKLVVSPHGRTESQVYLLDNESGAPRCRAVVLLADCPDAVRFAEELARRWNAASA